MADFLGANGITRRRFGRTSANDDLEPVLGPHHGTHLIQDLRREGVVRPIPVQPEGDKVNPTKTATILKLLRRPKGASIAQLQKATDWQAHNIRAVLTGLGD